MILVVHMLMFDVKNRRFCFVNMFGWNPHLTFIYAATFLHCLLLTSVLPDEDCLGLESFSDSDSLQLLILLLFTIYNIVLTTQFWKIKSETLWLLLLLLFSPLISSLTVWSSLWLLCLWSRWEIGLEKKIFKNMIFFGCTGNYLIHLLLQLCRQVLTFIKF